MPESEQQREDRAKQLAYQQGRRDSDVDARILSHERRLNAINGSIERHANEAAALKNSIVQLADKIDEVMAELKTKKAVEADRVKQIKAANEKQISNKMFWLGVATICAMIFVGFYANGGVG
jgi:chromosome segregation ATPase